MVDVAVIGGGPAGMMAAYAVAARGRSVALLEKNEKLGKKLFITGKGRCNLTNACEIPDYFSNIVKNPKFLMSALYGFTNTDLIALFAEHGLSVKTERGGRVFPVSDKSSDVIRTLEKLLRPGVTVALRCNVLDIQKTGNGFVIKTSRGEYSSRACIIATGGVSYPKTGSTGDGYRFARMLGHSVAPPTPALVPLEAQTDICARMQGLTLKNIAFSLFQGGKKVYQEQGELLFTHFGLSGPVALSASCYIDHTKPGGLFCRIDLKPALTHEKLDARVLRDFAENSNKQMKNYMGALLPAKMIEPFLDALSFPPVRLLHAVTREERELLVGGLKKFQIPLLGTRPIEEAIITAGGISIKEINPSTMESKLAPGLYFAGEVGDYSALTGGYNLQIAFSTGFLAGSHA